MALVLADRVLETCNAPGTSAVTLLGAVTGYQSFASAIGNTNTCYYTIVDQNGANWEVGIGTVTSGGTNTLARTTILASSNSGSIVNFSTGSQNVFVTYPAEKSVYLDAAGTLNVNNLTVTGNASFTSTGAMLLPKGTTAQEPTGVAGYLRFNTDTSQFEGYNGSAWASVGGAAISNDTTTSTNEYPLFASSTSGTALTIYTSNAKLLYKPSTGEFQSSALVASNGIVVNNATIGTSYTIPTGSNAMSTGPVTVASGQTVTVPSGSRWVVI